MGALRTDWRAAELSEMDAGLCALAEKLTLYPATMLAEDLEALRRIGCDEESLHETIQVISYFNYINRIADATHVNLEPEMEPYPGES